MRAILRGNWNTREKDVCALIIRVAEEAEREIREKFLSLSISSSSSWAWRKSAG